MKSVNVRDFGAMGDGLQNDSPAFQKALEAGAERVEIPTGNYRIVETLRVSSNTHIEAAPDARIFSCGNTPKKRGDFLLTNAHHETGDENISLCGGVWDGNNHTPCNTKSDDLFDPNAWSGSCIDFFNVRKLTLRSITVANSVTYFIRLGRIDGFLFEDIAFRSAQKAFNQDGLHFSGFCCNGVVKRVRAETKGQTNDDLIALNADDSLVRLENLDLECGPIENIQFEDLYAEDCHTGVRILSVNSPIRNITIRRMEAGCRCYAINADGARYCRTPLFTDEERPDGIGLVDNVVLEDFTCWSTHPEMDTLFALESNVGEKGLIIRNFKRRTDLDANPSAPTFVARKITNAELALYENATDSAPVEAHRFPAANGLSDSFVCARSFSAMQLVRKA